MVWEGILTPTPLSRAYRVRLRYKLTDAPAVEVVDPRLETRDGEKPPHLYPGDRLCLFLPGSGEWSRDMLLAESVVPWASEWLLHYEVWLVTGDWTGGGQHPRAGRKQSRPDSP